MRFNAQSVAYVPSLGRQDNRMCADRARLPACHKGVYARPRRALQGDGVRGPLRKPKRATESLWKAPVAGNLRNERVDCFLSPQKGEGRAWIRSPFGGGRKTPRGSVRWP
jgi:hypothetical protein